MADSNGKASPCAGIVALIPARGGSKSVPRKNLYMLGGKPLITYAIDIVQKSERVDRVIVSTDDKEIADVSRRAGAEVPFIRPAKLAEDDTPDLPVFEHALRWLEENEGYVPELVVHMRPTSPLCRTELVDQGIECLLSDPKADSLRSVCVPMQSPYKMWRIEDGYMRPLLETGFKEPYNMPRQKLPTVYWQTGYVDIVRRRTVLEKKSMTGERILPLVIDSSEVIDIDGIEDFQRAELRLAAMRSEDG